MSKCDKIRTGILGSVCVTTLISCHSRDEKKKYKKLHREVDKMAAMMKEDDDEDDEDPKDEPDSDAEAEEEKESESEDDSESEESESEPEESDSESEAEVNTFNICRYRASFLIDFLH